MSMPSIQARLSGLSTVSVSLSPILRLPLYIIVPRALRSVPWAAAVGGFLREEIERTTAEKGWGRAS